jgi:hypothetical protein
MDLEHLIATALGFIAWSIAVFTLGYMLAKDSLSKNLVLAEETVRKARAWAEYHEKLNNIEEEKRVTIMELKRNRHT